MTGTSDEVSGQTSSTVSVNIFGDGCLIDSVDSGGYGDSYICRQD